MEKKDYMLGIVLVFAGVLFLLLNLNVLTFNWLLLILSVAFLVAYFFRGRTGYLAAGLILLGISIVNILNQYVFRTINIKAFVFLWILGIISLVMYSKQGTKGYLIFGCIFPAIGTYSLVEELTYSSVSWVLFLFLAISFYIIYHVGYKKFGIAWPRTLATIFVILSLLFLFSSQGILKHRFWKVISYLWPILLIIIGIRIIYNMVKGNKE